jgi:hypothetical protein
MLDVFDALPVPSAFVGARAARLERTAGKYGILVQCKWLERCRLGTTQIERLRALPRRPVVEDLSALRLRLAPPELAGPYSQAFAQFAQRALAHARAENHHIERVYGPFGRIHLARAFHTTALCRQPYVCGETTTHDLSCRRCIAEALRQQVSVDSTLPMPPLRPAEILLLTGR